MLQMKLSLRALGRLIAGRPACWIWAIALILCAMAPGRDALAQATSPGPQASPWAWAPEGCAHAVVIEDVSRAAAASAAFIAAGQQRTIGTLVARARATSAQRLGVDLWDAAALIAAGLDAAPGIALCWPAGQSHPLALVRLRDGAIWQAHVRRTVAGAYVQPTFSQDTMRGVSITQMRLADSLPPRLTWASRDGVMAIAGPGGDTALKALWAQPQGASLADAAKLTVLRQALGPAPMVAVSPATPAAKSDFWHAVALTPDAAGLRAAAATNSPGAAGLCGPKIRAEASTESLDLAHRLNPQASVALIAGASTQHLEAAIDAARIQAQALGSRVLGHQGRALMQEGQTALVPLRQTLGQMAAPWAWAMGLPEPGEVTAMTPWTAQTRAALVVRAQSAADRAALKRLAARWMRTGRPVEPAPPGALWARREVRVGKASGPCLTPQNHRSDWAVAIVGDTLVATWGPRWMDRTLAVLEEKPRASQEFGAALAALGLDVAGSASARPVVVGVAHLTRLAAHAETALIGGAGHLLGGGGGGGAWAGALPQLVRMGPTGDALREVEALGDVAVAVSCPGQGGIDVRVHERLAVPQ